ncbi:MAG: hypothetical protein FWF76_02345 [Oscillospiraceae bacterium]|nr:hypothetical protein [Oscillospiraceae bacterium]
MNQIKKMKNKLVAVLLAIVMVATLIPSATVAGSGNRSNDPYNYPDQAAGNEGFTIADALHTLRYLVELPTPIRSGARGTPYSANAFWEYQHMDPATDIITINDALQILRQLVNLSNTAARRVCERNPFTGRDGCGQRPTWVRWIESGDNGGATINPNETPSSQNGGRFYFTYCGCRGTAPPPPPEDRTLRIANMTLNPGNSWNDQRTATGTASGSITITNRGTAPSWLNITTSGGTVRARVAANAPATFGASSHTITARRGSGANAATTTFTVTIAARTAVPPPPPPTFSVPNVVLNPGNNWISSVDVAGTATGAITVTPPSNLPDWFTNVEVNQLMGRIMFTATPPVDTNQVFTFTAAREGLTAQFTVTVTRDGGAPDFSLSPVTVQPPNNNTATSTPGGSATGPAVVRPGQTIPPWLNVTGNPDGTVTVSLVPGATPPSDVTQVPVIVDRGGAEANLVVTFLPEGTVQDTITVNGSDNATINFDNTNRNITQSVTVGGTATGDITITRPANAPDFLVVTPGTPITVALTDGGPAIGHTGTYTFQVLRGNANPATLTVNINLTPSANDSLSVPDLSLNPANEWEDSVTASGTGLGSSGMISIVRPTGTPEWLIVTGTIDGVTATLGAGHPETIEPAQSFPLTAVRNGITTTFNVSVEIPAGTVVPPTLMVVPDITFIRSNRDTTQSTQASGTANTNLTISDRGGAPAWVNIVPGADGVINVNLTPPPEEHPSQTWTITVTGTRASDGETATATFTITVNIPALGDRPLGPCGNTAGPFEGRGTIGSCHGATEGPICPVCEYCEYCDWGWFGVIQCNGCGIGSDCAAIEGRAFCAVCLNCDQDCACGTPAAFPVGTGNVTCVNARCIAPATPAQRPGCMHCNWCHLCLYDTPQDPDGGSAPGVPFGSIITGTGACGICRSMQGQNWG